MTAPPVETLDTFDLALIRASLGTCLTTLRTTYGAHADSNRYISEKYPNTIEAMTSLISKIQVKMDAVISDIPEEGA